MIGLVPRSLDEALELRLKHPEAVPVAGGTDLMVALNSQDGEGPRALLDLSHVDELKRWERERGVVFVGAGLTFARISEELRDFVPLAQAARSVASRQIRNRATIGGNVATASPAGDSLPVLAAYGANVVLAAAGGRERRVAWEEFLLGPKRTALAPDELIVGVEWAPVPGPASFAKVGRRNAMVISIASACLQLDVAAHRVRLALGSVGPTVVRAHEAEDFAAAGLDWEDPAPSDLDEFGRLATKETRPIDDARGSAAYRRRAVEVLARRTLAWALEDPC